MVKDVTNSPKDVHDFWYNSEDIAPETNNNYNQLVDHLVSTMKPNPSDQMNNNIYSVPDNNPRKSFDQLYEEFSSKSIEDQVENLKGLGRKLVSQIDGIVDKLNDIIEEDNTEQSKDNEFEITVDPLTHKVIYNPELNEYKVVRRKD